MKREYIVVSLIIGLSILGYAIINSRTRLILDEREMLRSRQEREEREDKIQECKNLAHSNYITAWNASCKNRGSDDSCMLPSDLANSYEDTRQKNYDDCFEMYK